MTKQPCPNERHRCNFGTPIWLGSSVDNIKAGTRTCAICGLVEYYRPTCNIAAYIKNGWQWVTIENNKNVRV